MTTSHAKEYYLNVFERDEKSGAGFEPAWLRERRRSAIASFQELGFPTSRDEEWRHTNVEPLLAVDFGRANGGGQTLQVEELFASSFTDPAYNRLVFINGAYSPTLSSLRGIAASVRVESLAAALKNDDPVLEAHLSQYARDHEQAFTALNTAFAADGALIHVPKGVVIEEPIYLVYASVGDTKPFLSQPRNLVLLDSSSQTRIVESFIGAGEQVYFNNVVTEIVGGEGATIDYYRLQREGKNGFHIGALEARLHAHCNLTAHAITLSGALVRNDVHVVLAGEGAECFLSGLYLLEGKQHVDNHTEIEHVQPRATSFELYKGILGGAAHAVFNGKILVHKDAQKTNARQTNKNLLLSEDAVVNTKPQLEIHADDVKCSHGSTIGQLDRDALFYLRSRGLDLSDAQSLLSYAFASDVVGRIKIGPMRARLDDYLLTKFGRHERTGN
jgi:Fe-S cluster assembly protein SufD